MKTQTWPTGRITKRRVWGLATTALLWVAPTMAQEKEIMEAGRREFQRSCATCHGVDATGNGPSAAFLNVKPTDLTQ